MEATGKDIWQMMEEPQEGMDAVTGLWSWSMNYDAGKGPATLFLDLIGYSDEEFGQTMYQGSYPLGYIECGMLAKALTLYAEKPHEVSAYVRELLEAESCA